MENTKKIDQELVMKTSTWKRDSHGLFDYESRHIHRRTLTTAKSCKLIRLHNDIVMINELQSVPVEAKVLASIKKNETNFTIKCSNESKEGEKLWLVVRSIKNQNGVRGYKLSENDIIKLGRVKFKLQKQEKTFNEEKPETENLIECESENFCRFCLNGDYTEENPLISPCQCSGTVKLIHIKCLQNWISSKCIEKITPNANSYYWKSLDCELCKAPYPMQLVQNDETKQSQDLIKLPKPQSENYFVLESLPKQGSNSKIIHFVNIGNKSQIVLGRGHDSDVRISDISVSRSHALISQSTECPNQLFLEDNSSKFGTLIQIKKGININYKSLLALQIGRTVVSFQIKRNLESLTSETLDQGQAPLQIQSDSSEEEFMSFEEENNAMLSNVKL